MPDLQDLTLEQRRAIAKAKARKRMALSAEPPAAEQEPSDAVRPAPKQTATLNPSQEAQLAMFGKLDRAVEGNPGRMAAFAAQTGNAATAGGFDYLMGGLDQLAPGAGAIDKGSIGDSVARMRETRQGLREEHPWSAGAGDITGALALGLPAFKATAGMGDDIVRSIPGKNAFAQSARFMTRGAGSALEGLKQLALYEAGAGGSNRAAEEGREVGLGERFEMAGDAVTDPVMGGLAAGAGPLGIAGSRMIRYGAKGRFTPSDVPGGVGQAPALADIEQMKQQAYQIADDIGVSYTPDSFADLVARIENKLTQEGIDPVLHQKATRNLRRIQDRVGDQPITLQELDRIRQFTRRDVIDSSMGANASPGEARLGAMVMDEIDDFIEAGAGAVGGGEQAGQAINQARALNAVWRRGQLLADAVENAQLRSASTGSGGNFENALRQEIRKLYQNPKKMRGFDEAERTAMRKVIEGGPVQNILRQIGKLSPQGNGLMASIGIGSTAAQPLLAPVWLGGMAAKHMAEKGIKGKFDQLDDLVRSKASQNAFSGSPPPASTASAANAFGGQPQPSPQTLQAPQSQNAFAPAPTGGDIKQMGFFGGSSNRGSKPITASAIAKQMSATNRAASRHAPLSEVNKPGPDQFHQAKRAVEDLQAKGMGEMDASAQRFIAQAEGPPGFQRWLDENQPPKPPELNDLERQIKDINARMARLTGGDDSSMFTASPEFSDATVAKYRDLEHQARQIEQRAMGWQEEYDAALTKWWRDNEDEILRQRALYFGDDAASSQMGAGIDSRMGTAIGLGTLTAAATAGGGRNAFAGDELNQPQR